MTSLKDDTKVVVAIDFGTMFSGYAYAHRARPDEISEGKKWNGFEGCKAPTIIRYKDDYYSTVESWGFSTLPEKPKKSKKGKNNRSDQYKSIELFKLFLFKDLMEYPFLPDGLDYRSVIKDYLEQLGKMIKEKLDTHSWPNFDFYRDVLIVLTIPVEFDDDAIAIMRYCAFNAGLTKEEESKNLIFTTEPEAAAIHCLNSSEKNNLKLGDSFIVVDCGGGTVNLTSHELLTNSRIGEITESTSGNCGSSLIDKKFLEFLRHKLGNSIFESLEKKHYNLLQYLVQEFCNEVKIPFTGEKSDFQQHEIFLEDYYPLKDIIEEARGQGSLKEAKINVEFSDVKGMFDPLIEKIIGLIKGQLGQLAQQPNKKCSAIMLVGGFSESRYLQARIEKEFDNIVSNIFVPTQPMIATLKGGVQYGLQVETVVDRVLKRTYGTDIIRRSKPGDPPSQMLPNGYTIVFDALAKRGKRVSVNDKVIRKFKPHSIMQSSVGFDLYVTKAFSAKFCNDPGVRKVRPWEIELPENSDNDDGDMTILFTLTFGTLEILATAENQKTGKKYQVRVKYE